MDVSSVNSYAPAAAQAAGPQGSGASQKEPQAAVVTEEPAAVYEGTKETPRVTTYSSSGKVNTSALLSEAQRKMDQFAQMISTLLGRQANTSILAGGSDALFSKENMQAAFQNASPEDVAWAREQIADGGYYSVEATADRIFSMAEALAGGDPEKMEQMRAAVEKGFSQAASAFGAELPDICQQTHARINEMFDNWGKADRTEEAEA